jgi:hypothetical protein
MRSRAARRLCGWGGWQAREHGRDDAVAASAGEREDIAGGHVEVAGKRRAKEGAGAEETGPNRRRRDGKTLRDLVDAHVFDLAHHEDGSKRSGKLIDPPLEDAPGLGANRRG